MWEDLCCVLTQVHVLVQMIYVYVAMRVFACSRGCPGDEAQGMSHGFVVIQIQLRTTCVPTAVESQTRLSVYVPTTVGSQTRFPTVVESRTRLSVCVPTAVESQTASRRSSW